jgi:L-rhamnose isomerase / sugar isomerase
LTAAQDSLDAMAGHRLIKQAYKTDASPILVEARRRKGDAIDPLSIYRASGYRAQRLGKDR